MTYTFQSYSESGGLCLKDKTLATTYSRIEGDETSSNPRKETRVTVILRKQTVVSGYQIAYSTSKNFKNKKLVTTKHTKVTLKN